MSVYTASKRPQQSARHVMLSAQIPSQEHAGLKSRLSMVRGGSATHFRCSLHVAAGVAAAQQIHQHGEETAGLAALRRRVAAGARPRHSRPGWHAGSVTGAAGSTAMLRFLTLWYKAELCISGAQLLQVYASLTRLVACMHGMSKLSKPAKCHEHVLVITCCQQISCIAMQTCSKCVLSACERACRAIAGGSWWCCSRMGERTSAWRSLMTTPMPLGQTL